MIDKIRKYIYAQKAKLVRGACAAQVAMETACKEEAYDKILAYIDKLDKREGPTAMERYDVILYAAQKAVGAYLTPERTMENTDIRMLVVKQMRDEGYSNAVIGVLIHRDHSTVSYLYKCVNEMIAMPKAFTKFMHVYNRFKEYLENEQREDNTDTQAGGLPGQALQEHEERRADGEARTEVQHLSPDRAETRPEEDQAVHA